MNRSPGVMTAMQHEYLRNTDVPLFQDPDPTNHITCSSLRRYRGFKTILLIPIDQEGHHQRTDSPGVVAYARKQNDMIIVPRYYICVDCDAMATGIQQQPHQPVLDVTIYNPPAGSIGGHLTGQQSLKQPDTYPTGKAGDFDLQRPD